MNSFASLIEKISSAVWGWPMIILLLGTHIFMTIRLRFPQLRAFVMLMIKFASLINSTRICDI